MVGASADTRDVKASRFERQIAPSRMRAQHCNKVTARAARYQPAPKLMRIVNGPAISLRRLVPHGEVASQNCAGSSPSRWASIG